jgi:pimeloyl-ACP methyl ester carboxylesterase
MPLFSDDAVTQLLYPPSPDQGYNFPYILQVPARGTTSLPHLLVETNNSGPISLEFGPHIQPTSELARQGLGGRVGQLLRAPLLMPVFPRETTLYTHSLGRATLVTDRRALKRLDLQLLAMARDAKRNLMMQGHSLRPRIVLTGFSASAMFATRLAALHPTEVAAVAAGGLNGFVILPAERLSDKRLPFPLGVSDFHELAGRKFDEGAWRTVPQLLFMGENDTNDAVDFEDSYSSADRETIHTLLGKRMIPDRWQACERVYRDFRAPARFRTFAGLGHGTNRAVHQECAAFVIEATTRLPPR